MPNTANNVRTAVLAVDRITSVRVPLGITVDYLVGFAVECSNHSIQLPSEFRRSVLLASNSGLVPPLRKPHERPRARKFSPATVEAATRKYGDQLRDYRQRVLEAVLPVAGVVGDWYTEPDDELDRRPSYRFSAGATALAKVLVRTPVKDIPSGLESPNPQLKSQVRMHRGDREVGFVDFRRATLRHDSPMAAIRETVTAIQDWCLNPIDLNAATTVHPPVPWAAAEAAAEIAKRKGVDFARELDALA